MIAKLPRLGMPMAKMLLHTQHIFRMKSRDRIRVACFHLHPANFDDLIYQPESQLHVDRHWDPAIKDYVTKMYGILIVQDKDFPDTFTDTQGVRHNI